ncbi:triose-phosphate isomerase [Paenibacillus athensensis]|uniref:Triosephosphate isomerase n=1 Tax=Paenibacillus athensensis TaxID=1967502 RepID=A0A4Y8PZ77_9BACL|nr:triose-phosphate isomerase [Paenibacillus athensensis]MCD1260460.1 triose-phosphate isomerase [Paenibacillus athensensis]
MEHVLEDQIRRLVARLIDELGGADTLVPRRAGRERPLIAANWKMNMSLQTANRFIDGLQHAPYAHCRVVICPPYPLLAPLAARLEPLQVALGAQNLHEARQGAYTGEVHGELLAELGCAYVLIGHSERRAAGEAAQRVARKLARALETGLTPVLCIGETQAERDAGLTGSVLREQLLSALADIKTAAPDIVIAYEPVWAIGTGRTALPSEAQETHRYIRDVLGEWRSSRLAEEIPILYGGSVQAQTVGELCAMPDIDGALVGGASLAADTFEAIITALQKG